MEIWLDTSNVDFVGGAHDLGIVHGVTTNPTILSISKMCPEELIDTFLEIQSGLVAVQVLSDEVQEMCKQAKALSAISSRIVVKIPVTQQGIRAIYTLNQEGVQTLATAIFEPHQALLAFKAGANYLAPYLGKIADTGKDPIQVLSQMNFMKMRYGFDGMIMGAGIRDLATVLACLEMGICAVTLTEKIFNEFVADYNPTLLALQQFSKDWSESIFSKTVQIGN